MRVVERTFTKCEKFETFIAIVLVVSSYFLQSGSIGSLLLSNCPSVFLLYFLIWICYETQLRNTKTKLSIAGQLSLISLLQ